MSKTELTEKLKSLGAFWSYQANSLHDLPNRLLIEECLRWGDVPEILELFRLYQPREIKEVWKEKMMPDQRIYGHNYYLAIIFFNIQSPEKYIKPILNQNNRYERIKSFAR